MKDTWCSKLYYNDKFISGGAARNSRIKQSGGMNAIILKVATKAATEAFNEATLLANKANEGTIIQFPETIANCG